MERLVFGAGTSLPVRTRHRGAIGQEIDMEHSLIMTAMGPDRPGVLARISDTIDAHGGSWFESKVVRFAGQFTGILRFDCPDERHDELLAALQRLDPIRIHVVKEIDVPDRITKRLSFDILGQHRPGLMKQVATAITKTGANIEEIVSEREQYLPAGQILFRAVGSVEVVKDFDPAKIEDVLHEIGADLSVSITPMES
jgi:glycine cleavage system regulatory protein